MKTLRFTLIALLLSYCSVVKAESIETVKISDGSYVFYAGKGLGLNVYASIGEDGILLVDTMNISKDGDKLLAAIRQISDKPIKYVINTDSDFVHTEGYTFFAKQGATIIAQNEAHISQEIRTIKFEESMNINFNGKLLQIYHVNVNSFDDVLVHSIDDDLIIMGNIFDLEWVPIYFTGGFSGYLSAMEKAISMSTDSTKILPSNGNMTNSMSLKEHVFKTKQLINRLHELKIKNLTLETIYTDKELQANLEKFNTSETEGFMSGKLKERIIRRYLATDFVTAYPISDNQLKKLVGKFKYKNNTIATIYQAKTGFMYKETGYTAQLIAQSDKVFNVRGEDGQQVEFEISKQGEVTSLSFINNGQKQEAIKM